MENALIQGRVEALRRWMESQGLAAFIVPTLDPHNSEYLPRYWQAREWLTGFTGSAGMAVVTLREAALWTDSRYFLQAEAQLEGTPFQLMRDGCDDTPSVPEWLNACVGSGCVGYWGEMMTEELRQALFGGTALDNRQVDTDPFAEIWTDRPALPDAPVIVQPLPLAGESVGSKLARVRQWMAGLKEAPGAFFMSDLSEIAWLLNLRGADIEFNPFFLSYLLVQTDGAVLFVQPEKITPEAARQLADNGVTLRPYDGWATALEQLVGAGGPVVALPATTACCVVRQAVRAGVNCCFCTSPVPLFRAVKNEAEQDGFRRAMLEDGVAMVQFLRWLDENVATGRVTEMEVDRRLTAFRAARPGFCSLSFATIAAYAAHGAIVHYEAEPSTDAVLEPRGLLLLDSGGQYECGTTDITRTIALGPLTDEERRVYTLVLKGHIALSCCRFPDGTTGLQLDTAARYPLWQAGYDFGHGTGHGVGSRLGVHEDPHQIRKNYRPCTVVPFRAGMVVTNEPGIYVTGRFGVRIENMLLARPSLHTDFGSFLEFETLTLCPYDLRAVDASLLSAEEKQWVNRYHATVCRELLPLLDDEADRRWLEQATRAL